MADKKLILPSGEDAQEVTRAVERDQRDVVESERGTRRSLRLLNQRQFQTSRRPKGIVGY